MSLSMPPSDLPIFDQDTYDSVACLLEPHLMASYLAIVCDGCTALLAELRKPDIVCAPPRRLSEAAHRLSGSAGMLGFQRLGRRAHEFECAVTAGAPCIAVLAHDLEPVIEETIDAIRHRTVPIPAGRGVVAEVMR